MRWPGVPRTLTTPMMEGSARGTSVMGGGFTGVEVRALLDEHLRGVVHGLGVTVGTGADVSGIRVGVRCDLDGPCSVEIIRRDAATNILLAGSDPRRDGWALAW